MKTEVRSLRILRNILKITWFLVMVVLCFVLGLIIGYVVIGNGNLWEVFNRDTWQHIVEFVRP